MQDMFVFKVIEVALIAGVTVLIPRCWRRMTSYYRGQKEARLRTQEAVIALQGIIARRRDAACGHNGHGQAPERRAA